jgi:glutathione S-transferase
MQSEAAKLYYFHGRGRSQQSRWALSAAKIPFTNVCLSSSREFEELCASGKLTYNQVPMLEAGGQCISQSMAIVRHAARLGSLFGRDSQESSRCDEILDGITDARGAIISFPFMDDPHECCMRLQQSIQRFWPCFEALIERNASPPYVVGASLTVADVLLAELVDSTSEAFAATFGPEAAVGMLAPFSKLRALHQHVTGLPEIQALKNSDNWFPFPAGKVGADYVRNVRTVLS